LQQQLFVDLTNFEAFPVEMGWALRSISEHSIISDDIATHVVSHSHIIHAIVVIDSERHVMTMPTSLPRRIGGTTE
jgi:hypothetical protein